MGAYLRLTPATMAVLEFLVAADQPTWGLQIARATGRPTGTVYPLLERLEGEGFVYSRWEEESARAGPRRRLYELTPAGRSWAGQRLVHNTTGRK